MQLVTNKGKTISKHKHCSTGLFPQMMSPNGIVVFLLNIITGVSLPLVILLYSLHLCFIIFFFLYLTVSTDSVEIRSDRLFRVQDGFKGC